MTKHFIVSLSISLYKGSVQLIKLETKTVFQPKQAVAQNGSKKKTWSENATSLFSLLFSLVFLCLGHQPKKSQHFD